jgi:hypothetical protein
MNQDRLRFRSDCDKRPLKIGDIVRVCGVPDLSGIYEEGRARTMRVFKYALGRNFEIEGFDNWNCAELHFYIPIGPAEGWHGIVVEPFLLKRVNANIGT